ncbi:sensor histidine kinase [Paenibacillus periandrae]|uniref:sensor histidine kinase n=1 Tax=Paenibacillus periandrae TaxID=1761741 RepID=UPI001F08E625|nr:histidine kinase [Paenibacillus periandrae]
MRYVNRISFKSIRFKLILGFFLLIVPLIVLLIYNNYYAIQVVRNQVAHSNKSLTTLYMDQIDRNLGEVDKYLYNLAALESDLLSLDLSEKEFYDPYYFAKIRLANKLETDINNYKSMDTLFVYSSVNDEVISTKILKETYIERREIKAAIVQLIKDKQTLNKYDDDRWYVQKINNDYYLFHLIKTGNVYIGGWVQSTKLMAPLNLMELGQAGKSILVTDQFEAMSNAEFIADNSINLKLKPNAYNLVGKKNEYLQVNEKSKVGNFSLLVLVPDNIILERLPIFQRISSLILMGALIVLPVFYTYLRKVILLPINRIVVVMKRIRDGYLEDRIPVYPTSYEFELMNDTFNSMVSQINDLKITVYEEQLINQKAELKHLQLQINPHFFLNSLNIIYSLAQLKNYDLIQEMSLCLVQYMRFMFQSNLKFVSLSDELAHTSNYLRIQVMRFPDNFTYQIHTTESLKKALVPPLIIQTFVENTIKYAVTMDEPIHLDIHIDHLKPDLGVMKIIILDSGKGFPQDLFDGWQTQKSRIDEDREHIGIWNIRHRLRLLYQEQAKLIISNHHVDRGARIEIHLPVNFEE